MPARSALLVATTEYGDGSLAALQTPAFDANTLATLLSDPEVGSFEVQTLLNRTNAEVNLEIAKFFADRGPDDFLVLYFSGHGIPDPYGNLHLAHNDTLQRLLAATATSADFVRRMMDACGSRRQVLILDCCYAGAFARGAKGAADVAREFQGDGSARAILTATNATKRAWEGHVALKDSKLSLFTHFLAEGLQTGAADADGDGFITVEELFHFADRQIRGLAAEQKPQMSLLQQSGQLRLAKNRTPAARPDELPAETLREARSLKVGERLNAAIELEALLRQQHVGLVLAARELLVELSTDDSQRVRDQAHRALQSVPAPAPPQLVRTAELADAPADPVQAARKAAAREGLDTFADLLSKKLEAHQAGTITPASPPAQNEVAPRSGNHHGSSRPARPSRPATATGSRETAALGDPMRNKLAAQAAAHATPRPLAAAASGVPPVAPTQRSPLPQAPIARTPDSPPSLRPATGSASSSSSVPSPPQPGPDGVVTRHAPTSALAETRSEMASEVELERSLKTTRLPRVLAVGFTITSAIVWASWALIDTTKQQPPPSPPNPPPPAIEQRQVPALVEVVARTDIASAELLVDGSSHGIAGDGRWVVHLPPGRHRLEAKTRGTVVTSSTVTVNEGVPATVLLSTAEATIGNLLSGNDSQAPTAPGLEEGPHKRRWLVGQLQGHYHEKATLAPARISEGHGGYRLFLDAPQAKFDCELLLDGNGTPMAATKCKVQKYDALGEKQHDVFWWTKSRVTFACSTTTGVEACSGEYTLHYCGMQQECDTWPSERRVMRITRRFR